MTNTINNELMNTAKRICVNTHSELLVTVGMERMNLTFEEAMLMYFFTEVNPKEEAENTYTVIFDYFYGDKVVIKKDKFYTKGDKKYLLTCDYNTYRR